MKGQEKSKYVFEKMKKSQDFEEMLFREQLIFEENVIISERKISDHFFTSIIFLMVHKRTGAKEDTFSINTLGKNLSSEFKRKGFEAHDIKKRIIVCTQSTNNVIKCS